VNGNVIHINKPKYKTYDAYRCLVNLMQQLSQELEQDEARTFMSQVGSPIADSPPGKYLLIQFVTGSWAQFGCPVEPNPLGSYNKFPGLGHTSLISTNHLSGSAAILSPHTSTFANSRST